MTRAGLAALPSHMRHVLGQLHAHGEWHTGCGWVVGSATITRRAVRGLVHRGIVTSELRDGVRVYRPVTAAEFAERRRRRPARPRP